MKNKLISLLILTLVLSSTKTAYAADKSQDINLYYDTAIPCEMYYANYKNIDIYISNTDCANKITNVINYIPQQLLNSFSEGEGKLIITDKEYINRVYYTENTILKRGQNYTLGKILNKEELWGEFRTDSNDICITEFLNDTEMATVLLHELGHYFDKQYKISEKMTTEDIDNIASLSASLSPFNNKEHIEDDSSEAFAESLWIYCWHRDKLAEKCPNIKNFWDNVIIYYTNNNQDEHEINLDFKIIGD